jgi:hypothetical protein
MLAETTGDVEVFTWLIDFSDTTIEDFMLYPLDIDIIASTFVTVFE